VTLVAFKQAPANPESLIDWVEVIVWFDKAEFIIWADKAEHISIFG
jgi:hypothetical protein